MFICVKCADKRGITSAWNRYFKECADCKTNQACSDIIYELKVERLPTNLPKTLTAENGAKALFSGYYIEFQDLHFDGTEYVNKFHISFTTIQEIYKKIVEHYDK